MFTGLVEEKGKIKQTGVSGALRLAVEAPVVSGDVKIGDSVSVNGVCLTAVKVAPPVLEFEAVGETVERSTLGSLRTGDSVNLERPLRAGDRLGGHMVLGHVDGIGRVTDIRRGGAQTSIRFHATAEIMKYVVEKGSIAVDGISLTIADLGADWFSVAVIPHTLATTNLGERSIGDLVNLETDILGKYVLKFMGNAGTSDESLLKKLEEGGFIE